VQLLQLVRPGLHVQCEVYLLFCSTRLPEIARMIV
jgi:hypothetical protein